MSYCDHFGAFFSDLHDRPAVNEVTAGKGFKAKMFMANKYSVDKM